VVNATVNSYYYSFEYFIVREVAVSLLFVLSNNRSFQSFIKINEQPHFFCRK